MQYKSNYPYATSSQQYGAGSLSREEQRRRQQEYSQALAQQVAQREEQKRREREMDKQYGRRNGSFLNPPQQAQKTRQEQLPPDRGILGGLGHNNPQNSRTSFAQGQPQLHHQLPGPEPLDYSEPPDFQSRRVSYAGQAMQQPQQPPVYNQNFQGGFGFPVGPNQHHQHQPMQQQNWQQQFAHSDHRFVPGPGPNIQVSWPQQNPQQTSMSQVRNSQFWPGQGIVEQAQSIGAYGSPQRLQQNNMHPQVEPLNHSQFHNAGRRQQPNIHNGGRGNFDENEKLRRKLHQQQEMQLALERQIEEKRQQKLEAKRRQEEEDRREMERFEEDQRRQRAEQERLQEEKRRKAELEQLKADQAAAAVAAANQQAKFQQQQKLHAQISHTQLQHPLPYPQQHNFQSQLQQQQQQPEHFTNAPAPNSLKNPFTNSRAHLFEDPPPPLSPQHNPMPPKNQFGFSNQNVSPVRGSPQSFGRAFQHGNNAVGPSVDPVELRRQYDDMKEELRKQKQLVDQIRQAQAQIQHQHQQQQRSPVGEEIGSIPTLMDLEKLCNELRGELEYREHLHRQELASLKREKQQERSPEHSPRHHPNVKNSLELPVRDVPNNVERASRHPIDNGRGAHISRIDLYHQQQKSIAKLQTSQVSIKHVARLDEEPLSESLMSLRGESKFVYFDGRVAEDKIKTKSGVIRREEVLEEEQDGEVLDEQSKSPQIRRSIKKNHSPAKPLGVKSSIGATAASLFTRKENQEDVDTDSEDDDHEFVVTRTVSSPSHNRTVSSLSSRSFRAAASSDRYSRMPSVLTSLSSTKNNGKWRLESMGTNDASDSDDDLDASLDGEQLEALFQRNVRRHEILLGFQNKVQHDSKQLKVNGTHHSKMAWVELHQQLQSNKRTSIFAQQKLNTSSSNDSNYGPTMDADDEAALVTSSQWMASSLFQPEEQDKSKV